MDAAVKAAHTAFDGEWSWRAPHERRKLPLKVHDVVLDNFEELAMIETLDVGAPLARTRGLKEWTSQVLQFFATQTDEATVAAAPSSLPGDFLTPAGRRRPARSAARSRVRPARPRRRPEKVNACLLPRDPYTPLLWVGTPSALTATSGSPDWRLQRPDLARLTYFLYSA
ncbi:aldehyde dehydrogenase family protein [Streptomyces sp. NPDC048425]|uniref:aldehyde dehydrogenase family protein n=1 Tax=Streptomyces sp. NPDC048425 TaxID=3365548 RepID=UPI003712202A